LVKKGQRILEGVNITVVKLDQIKTPNPTLSDKDSEDIGVKIRYLIDVMENLLNKITPVSKASIFNQSVTAGANILSSGLSPSNSPTVFRIYACFDTSGVLSVVRTKDTTTVTEQLNGGSSLSANSSYIFDIIVESDETINLRYSVNATCLILKVVEISGVIG